MGHKKDTLSAHSPAYILEQYCVTIFHTIQAGGVLLLSLPRVRPLVPACVAWLCRLARSLQRASAQCSPGC